MALDIEEQYEKIYRYCFNRLRDREQAEDITQEAFLRWFASDTYRDTGQVLQYLYTIARNLCTDEFRRPRHSSLSEDVPSREADPVLSAALRVELERLDPEDQELVLLRYVNKVPVGRCLTAAVSLGIQHRSIPQRPRAVGQLLHGKTQGHRIGKPAAGRLLEPDRSRPLRRRGGADIQRILDRIGFFRVQLELRGAALLPADTLPDALSQPPGHPAARLPQHSIPLPHQLEGTFSTIRHL